MDLTLIRTTCLRTTKDVRTQLKLVRYHVCACEKWEVLHIFASTKCKRLKVTKIKEYSVFMLIFLSQWLVKDKKIFKRHTYEPGNVRFCQILKFWGFLMWNKHLPYATGWVGLFCYKLEM